MMAFELGRYSATGHPQPTAVVVDAARMVHVPFAQLEVGQQRAVGVDDVQVAHPAARCPVVAVAGHRTGLGGLDDLDRRDEEAVADLDHSLWMLGVEWQIDGVDVLPRRRPGDGRQGGHDGIVLSMTLRRRTRRVQDERADEHTDRSPNRCLFHGPSSCGNRFRPLRLQDGTGVTAGEGSGGEQGVTGRETPNAAIAATARRTAGPPRGADLVGHDGNSRRGFRRLRSPASTRCTSCAGRSGHLSATIWLRTLTNPRR